MPIETLNPCLVEALPQVQLSIVVCARNEEASVEVVLGQLSAVFPQAELLLVDNGSTDATARLAGAVPGVRVISDRRPGKGNAMRTGAAAASGEWLLFHDADGEYCVEDSAAVVACARAADGCGIGVRLVSYRAVMPSSWAANRLIRGLLKWQTGADIPDVLTGTRCLRAVVFKELATTSTHFGIETEIARKVALRGIPCTGSAVRFTPRDRAAGKKIRAWHLLALIYEALKGRRAR